MATNMSPFWKALLSRWFSELPQVGYVSLVEGNGIFFLTVFSCKINTEVQSVQSSVALSGWRMVSFQYHSAWESTKQKLFWEASPWWVDVILQYRFGLTHLILVGFLHFKLLMIFHVCFLCIFIDFCSWISSSSSRSQPTVLEPEEPVACQNVGSSERHSPGISTYWKIRGFVLSKGFTGKEHLWVVACGHKSNLLAHPLNKKNYFRKCFCLKKINDWTGKQLKCFAGTSVPSLTNIYIHITYWKKYQRILDPG